MIKSMTGYGRGEYVSETGSCAVEISATNHRYLDISVHMPRQFGLHENSLKTLIKERFSRGRFSVSVILNLADTSFEKLNIDYQLVKEYVEALSEMKKRFNLLGDLDIQTVSRLRDIWSIEDREQDDGMIWNLIESALNGAMESLEEMRKREGEALYGDISGRIGLIAGYLEQLKNELPGIMERHYARVKEKINDLLGELGLDEARFSQEAAILAERSDVTEEITRIDSHLKQFLDLIKTEGPVGRKLDFLLQEINREINTTGAKVGDLKVSNFVIEIKSELEKIREQVQNIE